MGAGDWGRAGALAEEGASADVFVSSVVAVTSQTGEVLAVDASGSRVKVRRRSPRRWSGGVLPRFLGGLRGRPIVASLNEPPV
jgi:hypothetical protein